MTCSARTPATRPARPARPPRSPRCAPAAPGGWATLSRPFRRTRVASLARTCAEFSSGEAARVKGEAKMAGVLAAAVTGLRQVPASTIEIKVDGTTYRLTPGLCGRARAEAERATDPDTGILLPHNAARRVFIRLAVRELARPRARDLGGRRVWEPGDEQGLRAELADTPAIQRVVAALWPAAPPHPR